jgi:hypothetical protein
MRRNSHTSKKSKNKNCEALSVVVLSPMQLGISPFAFCHCCCTFVLLTYFIRLLDF